MTNVPENNYIKTLNKTGVSTRYLDDMARAGLKFAKGKEKPVLDLGCGFGAVTTALLAQGNQVLANDLDLGHLEALRKSHPPEVNQLLKTIGGSFPNEVKLQPNPFRRSSLAGLSIFFREQISKDLPSSSTKRLSRAENVLFPQVHLT